MSVVIPGRKDSTAILNDMKSNLRSRTDISLTSRDSKAGALQEIFANQLIVSRQQVIEAFRDSTLNAQGQALDRVGADFGIKRLLATKASALKSFRTFAFYVDSGTFGDLNSGLDIVIPAGELVYTEANQNDLGRKIIYKTLEETTLSSGSSVAFASIEAEGFGSDYNIGEGTLTNHGFTNYTNGSGLKCINFYPILNGRNEQSDKNYRSSIVNFFASQNIVNDLRIKLSALNIPGVVDTRIIDSYYGIGTSAIVVLGAEFQTTPSLILTVQQLLNSLAQPGISFYALTATRAAFDISISIKITREYSTNEKLNITNRIRIALRNYLRGRGLGGTISFEDLFVNVTSAVSDISFIKNNTNVLFDSILISRNSSTTSHPGYETVVNSFYTLDEIEYADIGNITIEYVS